MSAEGDTAAWLDKAIASPRNPVFSSLLDCLDGRGIRKHGLFLVSGEKAVRDVLERHPHRVRSLMLSLDRHVDAAAGQPAPKNRTIAAMVESVRRENRSRPARQAGQAQVIGLAGALFEELDRFGTHAPMLALSAPKLEAADLSKAPSGLEVLCALSDPSNVGALLRSAAAFEAGALVLLKESASPFHPRAVRAASGATLSLPLLAGPSIRDLPGISRSGASRIIALDARGETITSMNWPRDARILIGEEGLGVPEPDAFQSIAIPMAPGVESLNAAVAAGIALYAYRAQNPL